MFDRFIQVVPTFSPEEVKTILDECEDDPGWERAEVYDRNGKDTITDQVRTNNRLVWHADKKCYSMVIERLNEAFKMYTRYVLASIPKEDLRMPMPMAYGSQSTIEGLVLLRYTKDQHYDWHTDASYREGTPSSDRTISVVTYLNNDFEGGMTEFIDGARKPKPGCTLFFPSNWVFRHRAQPVTKGTKYALVTWYRVFDAT